MTWCTYLQSFEKIHQCVFELQCEKLNVTDRRTDRRTDGGCCNISRPGPSAPREITKYLIQELMSTFVCGIQLYLCDDACPNPTFTLMPYSISHTWGISWGTYMWTGPGRARYHLGVSTCSVTRDTTDYHTTWHLHRVSVWHLWWWCPGRR